MNQTADYTGYTTMTSNSAAIDHRSGAMPIAPLGHAMNSDAFDGVVEDGDAGDDRDDRDDTAAALRVSWEVEFATLLGELSAVQSELLATLTDKRQLLISADGEGLSALTVREATLVERLTACQDRRLSLLARANDEGLPAQNLRVLARSLPNAQHRQLAPQIDQAKRRSRELQHHSLTNWVLAQRTLIHLSQLLEIIATGGRTKPTYGKENAADTGGTLLNQVG